MQTNTNKLCKEINLVNTDQDIINRRVSQSFDEKKVRETAEMYFEYIKLDHQKYLKNTMITNLDVIKKNHQKKLMRQLLKYIEFYEQEKNHYLNEAISQPSLTTRASRGAISALLGIGIAVAANHFLQQKTDLVSGVTDGISPIAAVSRVTARAAFSGIIGAACSTLVYKAWNACTENAAAADFEQFQQELKKAGFTDEGYNILSERLVKLFHFRECLLLGLHDNSDINMRMEFTKNYIDPEIKDDMINSAIEAYFLSKLGQLFQEAFAEIYKIHDNAITAEKNQSKIITWIKSFFQDEKKRQQFSQELQIEFMNRCITYLQKEMLEPTFMAKNISISLLLSGLIFASIGITITFFLTNPIVPVMIASGLLTFFLGIFLTNFLFNSIEALKYSRSRANRNAIKESIDNIQREQSRLSLLIQTVKETTQQDIESLKNYNNLNQTGKILQLFGAEKKFSFVGYSHSWIRDYASRYRHSKAIEIDLSEQEIKIILQAEEQTTLLKKIINCVLENNKDSDTEDKINKLIKRTRDYLIQQENQEFIKKNELLQKIKEQILNAIAYLEKSHLESNILTQLLEFYTDSLKNGGLNGHASEWLHAIEIGSKPRNKKDVEILCTALKTIMKTASAMNEKLNKYKSNIKPLEGDSHYRNMLRLHNTQDEIYLAKMDPNIFLKKLQASFDFLYSLNDYSKNQINIDDIIPISKEFIMYRMLLLKQLAELSNHNNINTHPRNRELIFQFCKLWLDCDPDIIFDDYRNQILFNDEEIDPVKIKDDNDNQYIADELMHISSAIRVDLAYNSQKMNRRKLLLTVYRAWQNKLGEKNIFGIKNSLMSTIPTNNSSFMIEVTNSIKNSNNYLEFINTYNCFSMLKLNECAEKLMNDEKLFLIEKIKKYINHYHEAQQKDNTNYLEKTLAALKNWQLKFFENINITHEASYFKKRFQVQKKNNAALKEKNTPSSERSPEIIAIQDLGNQISESKKIQSETKLEKTLENINLVIHDLQQYIIFYQDLQQKNTNLFFICSGEKYSQKINKAKNLINYLSAVKNKTANFDARPWHDTGNTKKSLQNCITESLSFLKIQSLDELISDLVPPENIQENKIVLLSTLK